jgi:hypothetical protein
MAMSMVWAAGAAAFDHAYDDYAAVLGRHVHWTADGHASGVAYAALKRDQAALQAVLDALSAVTPAQFEAFDRDQQMAFLINAYNAFTLQLVLTRYPDLESIRELGSLLRSPWKRPFFELLGQTRHLDWIEHDRLRPDYADPRVHFAVNCASIGCPALRPEPYRADRLAAQLDDQQRRFLTDRTRNRFNAADGRLRVSPIFKWFAEDFGGDPRAWLSVRAALVADTPADRARIAAGDFRLDHLSYDWTLNDLKGSP